MRKTILGWLDKYVKLYSIIPLLTAFLYNTLIYEATLWGCRNLYHYDFTSALDRRLPLIPEFVSIYLICYLFWMANYILVGHLGKEKFYRFITADLMSRTVCLVFFVLMPTTNIRPELTRTDFWAEILKLIWKIDPPYNLFPSIHCLVSGFCYIGIRGEKQIPAWYRGFSCVFAILVFISTVVTKQHYLLDVAGGVILAEGMLFINQKYNYYQKCNKIFTKLNCKMERLLLKS